MTNWRSGRAVLHGALAAQALVLVVAFAVTGLSIDLFSIGLIILPILICTGVAIAYRNRTDAPKLAIGAEAAAILMTTLSLGELITYAAGSGSAAYPYADAKLRAAGLALGFDWLDYAAMINGYPWLCQILEAAYNSFNVQPLLVLFGLTLYGKVDRLRIFLFATSIALSVTCLIFLFTPAMSAYGYFGAAARQLTNIYPPGGDTHVTILQQHISFLDGLRNGSFRSVSAQTLTGLITFPSFHACAAFLFLWALWGIQALRVPALLLNLLMLAASPLFGAHYIVDLIAGAVVAVVSVVVSACIFARKDVGRPWLPAFSLSGRKQPAPDVASTPLG